VAAWSTDEETQEALQYLLGICASHVPENPGLITDCPTYIPLNPTTPPAPPAPPVTPSGSSPPSAPPVVTTPAPESSAAYTPPVTTITYQTTVTTPCSCAESTSVVETIQTTITVPQVIFVTQTPAQPPPPGAAPSEPPVVLVPPGTPPPVSAGTTLPPYPTGGVPTSLGTVTIPSASASFSAPPQFTGAASPVRRNFAPAFLGAALAFFAL
jgi:hypothetical protein